MADFDLTTQYKDTSPELATPHWDLGAYKTRHTDPNLDFKFRRPMTRRKALKPSNWFNRLELKIPGLEQAASRIDSYYKPSVAQFSGTVIPAKAREGYICRLDHVGTARRRVILERVEIDPTGYFESKEWYPVETAGEYFLFVEGDDTHESKDFLLEAPARQEWQYGKDPNPSAIHHGYDTAANLRELLVHDEFTGPAGTMNGRTPDTVAPANWVASSMNTAQHLDAGGNYVASAAGSGATAVIDAGTPDVLMHMKFVPGDVALVNNQAGFILRWLNSLNFLFVSLSMITTDTPYLMFQEYQAGLPVAINTRILPGLATLNVDQYYQWKLLAQGENIWYQFSDGQKIWSDRVIHYPTHKNNTLHGFLLNTGQYVDDFKIWNA